MENNETTVVNVMTDEYDIYIGRRTIWGNPFYIGGGNTRDNVIRLYEEYMLSNKEIMDNLHTLKGKRLGCHCTPLPCHGDILKKYIDKLK